jgi:hypothetical protein
VCKPNLPVFLPVSQPVFARSFMLRLRRATEETVRNPQFFLKDIQTEETYDFANMGEIVRFLCGLGAFPGDQEV